MEVIARTAGEKTYLAKDRVTVKKVTFEPCGNGLGRAELSAEDAEIFLKAGASSGAYYTPKYEIGDKPPETKSAVVEVKPAAVITDKTGDEPKPPQTATDDDQDSPPGDTPSAIVEGYKQIPAGAKVTMLENLLATPEILKADIAAMLELEKAREDGGRKSWLSRLEKAL